MFNFDNNNQDISLSQVEKFDVIEYQNESIQNSIFVVFDTSIDEKIPALLLQLWNFEGGYDHAFANVVEVDFSLNKRVKHFIPKKQSMKIENILSYRPIETELSDKEQFFFNLWPKTTSPVKNDENPIPFEITVVGIEKEKLILPTWTPLQQIPIDKIKIGSRVEIWTAAGISTIMKVVKL
ncbi:MAG: hypothetical protein GPJ54_15155 [Candidatus Heimdallarchaeota archaeon]|nr:hypothetical protein [Candidatus Heimdallarchaeota archaeon]